MSERYRNGSGTLCFPAGGRTVEAVAVSSIADGGIIYESAKVTPYETK